MKRQLILFSCLLALSCGAQSTTTILDYNNVSAILKDEGVLFFGNGAGYEVPKGSGIHAIYTASFWFGGTDENDTLRLAVKTYGSGIDFFSGPYSSTDQYADPSFISNYDDAIWSVTRSDIQNHIQNFTQSGYITPTSIANWPGNGIISLGVSQNLAPFIDMNGDNIYTPSDGDYPDIRGDAASYVIMNDMASADTATNDEMGIEMHIMAYQFATNDYLNNTTFLNLRVFNKGIHSYSNFRTGFFMDGDLGNYSDDYIGSDSSRNMIYTYNADDNDEAAGGNMNYGLNPPCLGVVSLNNSMDVAGYFSSTAQFPYNGASNASQYWNFMNGKWADGSEWLYGGLGYAGSLGVSATPTNYIYSGNPYTGTGWTEISNNNPPGDRRNFMVLDSIILNPGQENCHDFAVIYNRQGNRLENVQGVLDLADSVKVFFDSQVNYNCDQVTLAISENENTQFSFFPNPSNGKFTIQPKNDLQDYQIEITDLSGRKVYTTKGQGNSPISVDLNEYSGVYLLSFYSNNGKSTKYIVID